MPGRFSGSKFGFIDEIKAAGSVEATQFAEAVQQLGLYRFIINESPPKSKRDK